MYLSKYICQALHVSHSALKILENTFALGITLPIKPDYIVFCCQVYIRCLYSQPDCDGRKGYRLDPFQTKLSEHETMGLFQDINHLSIESCRQKLIRDIFILLTLFYIT